MKYLLPVGKMPDGRLVCRVLKQNPSAPILNPAGITPREIRAGIQIALGRRGLGKKYLKAKQPWYAAWHFGYSEGTADSIARLASGAASDKAAAIGNDAYRLAGEAIKMAKGETGKANPPKHRKHRPAGRKNSSILEKLRQLRATGKGGTKEYMALMRGLRRNPIEEIEAARELELADMALDSAIEQEMEGNLGRAAVAAGAVSGKAHTISIHAREPIDRKVAVGIERTAHTVANRVMHQIDDLAERNPLTPAEFETAMRRSHLYGSTIAKGHKRAGNIPEYRYFDGYGNGMMETALEFGPAEWKYQREGPEGFVAMMKGEKPTKGYNTPSAAKEALRWSIARRKDPNAKKNPVDSGRETLTILENPTSAEKILKSFHGRVTRETRVRMPRLPKTAYEVGKLEAVIYRPPAGSKIGTTPRIHHFGNPQPRLLGFTNKPPWLILGGKAKFTYRGFVG